MKASLKWLREFVDIDFSPRILADRLTMAGLSVVNLERPEGIQDHVLDIEVTSNRPDCLSILGIAREIGAISRKRLMIPKINVREGKLTVAKTISVSVQDEKRCLRYCARVVTGVAVRPSPRWLADRLRTLNIRPVNVIVDVTNYVLMEYGQPLHAFDLDRLEGKRVVVRRAKTGESLVTLDGKKHLLHPEMLVIADAKRPVALAGVMGGAETEITDNTRNVLLESACFDPLAVRRASGRTKISSDSSYRFERGIDIEQVGAALDRAAVLIAKLTGGDVARGMIDMGRKRARPRRVSFWPKRVAALLGAEVPRKRIGEILTGLGVTVLKRERERWWIHIPSWRSDISRSVDLIEEIARIWGYDRIPTTLPQLRVDRASHDTRTENVWNIKDRLASAGLHEIMTYALLSRESLAKSGGSSGEPLPIQNPRSREQEILRPTLLAGLLASAAHNIHRRNMDFGFFEIGNTYAGGHGNPSEQLTLGMALSGHAHSNWAVKPRSYTLFDIKGFFELACKACSQTPVFESYVPDSSGSSKDILLGAYAPGSVLIIKMDGRACGVLGLVSGEVSSRFDVKQTVWAGELFIEQLISRPLQHKLGAAPVKMPPHLPAVRYDISFIADAECRASDILSLIDKAGRASITSSGLDAEFSVTLFDCYEGKPIPSNKRSLSYSLSFQPRHKTLLETDVKKVHEAVSAELIAKMGVEIRA